MASKPVGTILVLDGPTHYNVHLPELGKINFVSGDTILLYAEADIAAARALPFKVQIRINEFSKVVTPEAPAPIAAARKDGKRG